MDEYFTVHDLKALDELLSFEKNNLGLNNDLEQSNTAESGPENTSPAKENLSQNNKPTELSKNNSQNIWGLSEATTSPNSEIVDPRTIPEYEIKFKQSVTTEDVYLGIGFKTPASASCEWLSIDVKLPGEERENIILNVESEFVDIRSPKYRLHLPTSHVIDPNASSAKWHCNSSTLQLTLRMIRELDAVNF